MSLLPPVVGASRPRTIQQPCSEACAAFRLLIPDQWSEFGMCTHARSPRRGHPVRVGRECNDFQVQGKTADL